MPCIFALLALFVPRILIVVVWFFTDWFGGVFEGVLLPILGFLFLPTSLLWYSVVHNVYGGVWDVVPIVGMVIAVALDLSPAGGRRD